MKNQKKKKSETNLWIIPSVLALGVIPMIVKSHEYDTYLTRFPWFSDTNKYIDLFLYWKNFFIGITAFVMAGLLIIKSLKNKKLPTFKKEFFLMAVYLLLIIVSSIFCKYKNIMLHGTLEWFETVWVYTGVVIMMYYTLCVVNSEKDVIRTLEFATIGVSFVYLVGLLQYSGLNLFEVPFYKNLVLTAAQRAKGINLNVNFANKTVYATLYNPDFVSLYAGPLFFIFITLILYNKDTGKRILFGFFAVTSIVLQKGSTTLSGFVAMAAALYCAGLVYFGQTKKGRIISWSVTGGLAVCTVLFLNFVPFGHKVKNEFYGTYNLSDSYDLLDVESTEDSVIFYTKNDELHMIFENEGFSIRNKAGNLMEILLLDEDAGRYILEDRKTFGEVYINYAEFHTSETEMIKGWVVTLYERDWPLAKINGREVKYLNNDYNWMKLHKRNYIEIFKDDAMNHRGVQWNHIIPLLKNYLFIGSGPCTYVTVYPQDDYVFRSRWKTRNVFDVKGHSWYMTSAIEIGVLAVIMLIAFYIVYAVKAVKNFYKAKGRTKWLVLGILSSTFCYMVGCLANDSTVNTSVVFWIILGLGIALNIFLENEEKIEVKQKIKSGKKRQ